MQNQNFSTQNSCLLPSPFFSQSNRLQRILIVVEFWLLVSSIALSVSEALSIPAVGVVTSSQTLPTLKPVDSDRYVRTNMVIGVPVCAFVCRCCAVTHELCMHNHACKSRA